MPELEKKNITASLCKSISDENTNTHFDLDDYLNMIEQMSHMGYYGACFTYMEVKIKDFNKLLIAFKERGFKVSILKRFINNDNVFYEFIVDWRTPLNKK